MQGRLRSSGQPTQAGVTAPSEPRRNATTRTVRRDWSPWASIRTASSDRGRSMASSSSSRCSPRPDFSSGPCSADHRGETTSEGTAGLVATSVAATRRGRSRTRDRLPDPGARVVGRRRPRRARPPAVPGDQGLPVPVVQSDDHQGHREHRRGAPPEPRGASPLPRSLLGPGTASAGEPQLRTNMRDDQGRTSWMTSQVPSTQDATSTRRVACWSPWA